MSVTYISGDLFVNRAGAEAFAHGCNCQGSMGAGIAAEFRKRYPAMFEAYRALCRAEPRQFNPGDCFLWRAENQPWVFNLATQEGTRGKVRATYDAVEAALRAMRQQADEAGISSIAMPRIGAGLGGLAWEPIREMIDRLFTEWQGMLIVYETYVDETRSA